MADGEAVTLIEVVAHCLQGRATLAASVWPGCGEDIMSSPAVTVNKPTPVIQVASFLRPKKVNLVPVMNQDGRLVGIVSRADVIEANLLNAGLWTANARLGSAQKRPSEIL
jgi:CBS domain-containing protein